MSTAAISLPRVARHNPLAAIGVVLVVLFVLCALFAPLLAPQDPAHIDLPNRLDPPSVSQWCGTDELGRDICSRLIYGARISMLVGAQVLAAREKEFVEAARALGASDLRVIVSHILPNIIQPVIVQAAIGMAAAILAEATMSFLGLGVPPPAASWGSMLNDARAHLFDSPHLVLFPAAAVMLAVLSFNFIGDALRDLLDPRSRIEAGL